MGKARSETFGRALKALRLDRGLSQQALADLTDSVSAPYVSLLEQDKRSPSIETVNALAEALRCSRTERQRLHRHREATASAPAPLARIAQGDVRAAAVATANVRTALGELIRQMEEIAAALDHQWTGPAADAYRARAAEWLDYATQAEQAVEGMSGALSAYNQRLEDLNAEVARQLEG